MLKSAKYVALALVVAVSLTGCFGKKDNTAQPSGGGSGSEAPTTVKIWRTFEGPEIFQPIIDEFEQDNPDIKIEYRQIPSAEYELTVSEALAAGNGPDIWAIRNDWIPRHKDKLIPMPDGLLAEDQKNDEARLRELFAPVVANDVFIDGHVYGLPYYVDTMAIWKNTEVFDKRIEALQQLDRDDDADFLREPFNTWDKLQRAAQLLTQKDSKGNIVVSGLAAGTNGNISRAEDVIYAMMLQNGTQMLSPERSNATFHLGTRNSAGSTIFLGTEALKRYTSFADPSQPHYSWNSSMPNDVDAFMTGKAAMIFGFDYYKLIYNQVAPTLKYDVNPFPQVRDTDKPVDYPSYYVETVTKNARNPDAVWKVLKNLVIDRGGEYRSATKRPDPEPKLEPPSVIERGDSGQNPFDYQQQSATDWYKTKRPDKVDAIFRSLISDVTERGQTHQNAIEGAAKQVSEILQKER